MTSHSHVVGGGGSISEEYAVHLQVETAGFHKMSISTCHSPEGQNLNVLQHENLRSHDCNMSSVFVSVYFY
jgi:hypothetical protein